MQLTDAPAQIVLAFAADDTTKTAPFPVPSQIPVTPGAASYTDGFPPLCAVDPADGGQGPSKADMNGALFALSSIDLWVSAGGLFVYSSAFQTAIGGYPKGALLQQASGGGLWMSTVDNNMTNPDTGGGGWVNINTGTVLRMSASVVAGHSQTLAVGNAKVLFDTVEFDSAGLWDATDNRFVATVAGNYRVTGTVVIPAAAPQGVFVASVFKNGGASVKQCDITSQLSTGEISLGYNAIFNLAVSDYIELFLTVPQTAVVAGGTGTSFVYAQIEYLGT